MSCVNTLFSVFVVIMDIESIVVYSSWAPLEYASSRAVRKQLELKTGNNAIFVPRKAFHARNVINNITRRHGFP